MNTVQELTEYGFPESTALRMLDSYKGHIGEVHGCNMVTDVTYVENGSRDIELTCSLCGAQYHKIFKNCGNKWSELRKTCSCQMKLQDSAPRIGVLGNDDPSFIGKIYGDFRVVDIIRVPHKNKSGSTVMWLCECIHCGEVSRKQPCDVKKSKRCKCQMEAERAAIYDAEIGKKYNRLTVTKIEHRKSGTITRPYATCVCDCGGEIVTQLGNVVRGRTKSCGCLEEERLKKVRGSRGEARTRSPLYSTWSGMKQRCLNKNSKTYKDYGGRGIAICPEWLGPEGFDRFERWSYDNGYVPEAGLSLDRIDVNGNYEPSNCRYTTIYVQNVNKRPAKRRPVKTFTIDGESKTLNQWCREYHISSTAVNYRMKTLGMSLDEALKTPKTRKGNTLKEKRPEREMKAINKCNSYIEANLYLAFIRMTAKYELEPQYGVGHYRADFLVKGTNIIVECDGYDYHKTKEQMSLDYKRERFFTMSGYRVIRFTGSEINENPDKCCKEIIDIIEALYEPYRQTNAG